MERKVIGIIILIIFLSSLGMTYKIDKQRFAVRENKYVQNPGMLNLTPDYEISSGFQDTIPENCQNLLLEKNSTKFITEFLPFINTSYEDYQIESLAAKIDTEVYPNYGDRICNLTSFLSDVKNSLNLNFDENEVAGKINKIIEEKKKEPWIDDIVDDEKDSYRISNIVPDDTAPYLVGSTYVLAIFVKGPGESWPQADIDSAKSKILLAWDWIENRAPSAAQVSFQLDSRLIDISVKPKDSSSNSWMEEAAINLGYLDLDHDGKVTDDMIYSLKTINLKDNGIIIFVPHEGGRSFALRGIPRTNVYFYDGSWCVFTICIVQENYPTYVHEILHLFGAPDEYSEAPTCNFNSCYEPVVLAHFSLQPYYTNENCETCNINSVPSVMKSHNVILSNPYAISMGARCNIGWCDYDFDEILDPLDECITSQGPANNNGCPEAQCSLCFVENLECPEEVKPNSIFTIQYQIFGTGPDSFKYEVETIEKDSQPDSCFYNQNEPSCTYHTRYRDLTAPALEGQYNYTVKCYGASTEDASYCGYADDLKNCTINVTASICGDNVIDPGEQCEGQELNNVYCFQPQLTCQSKKTGTRDFYGDCNNCLCSNDEFVYRCIKDSCGAQCSDDSDCNDNNPRTIDICGSDCGCSHEVNISVDIRFPTNRTHENRKISVLVVLSEKVKAIYRSLNSNRFVQVCSNCNEFLGYITSREGLNNLAIKIQDYEGNEISKSVHFTVDYSKPRIIRTKPKGNIMTNGPVNFSITFTEINLDKILIDFNLTNSSESFVGQQEIFPDCDSGKSITCSLNANLSYLDGFKLVFRYILVDQFRNVTSKFSTIMIDSKAPVINIHNPQNLTYSNTRIRFVGNVTEKVNELEYSDNSGIFRRMCSNCDRFNRTLIFRRGLHNVTLRALDASNNIGYAFIEFDII